jgi:hypothetical protein
VIQFIPLFSPSEIVASNASSNKLASPIRGTAEENYNPHQ